MRDIQIKRVYEPTDMRDGTRILVDGVWPRGMTKEQVQADQWLKEAAPSAGLRKWFHHDPQKWEEFKARYFTELDARPEAVRRLLEAAAGNRLTLLYSARDAEHNQAAALKEYLLSQPEKKSG